MQYRRAKTPGGTYFFTVVTYQRRKILCEPDNIALLREIFRSVMTNHPFTIDAIVILPEHLHCIWTLPENDCDFSTRWRLIKSEFSRVVIQNTNNSPLHRDDENRSKPFGSVDFGNT